LIVLNLKKVLCQASSQNWQRCSQADISYKPGATAPKRGAAIAQDNAQTIPVMLQVANNRMGCSALHSRAGLGLQSTVQQSTAQHSTTQPAKHAQYITTLHDRTARQGLKPHNAAWQNHHNTEIGQSRV